MKKITLTLVFALSLCIAFSQSKFSEGYFISKQGDTSFGFLTRTSLATHAFQFKKNKGDTGSSRIHLADIKSFQDGRTTLIPFYTKRNMAYLDKMSFQIYNVDSVITEWIPLEMMVPGKISLLYFKDVIDHFFVSDGKYIQELSINYRYPTKDEQYKNQYKENAPLFYVNYMYRQQIRLLMNNQLSDKQDRLLELTLYEKNDMIRLFKLLNKS